MKNKNCPNCFKILSVQTRAKIIYYLGRREKSNVKNINSLFRLCQPTISHHLKVLKKLKILESEKVGKEMYYSLNKKYSCSRCNLFKTPYFHL